MANVYARPGSSRQIIYDRQTNSVYGFNITLYITDALNSADADAAIAAWVPPAGMFVVPVMTVDPETDAITFVPTDISACITSIGNISLTLQAVTGCEPDTFQVLNTRNYKATVLFLNTAGISTSF